MKSRFTFPAIILCLTLTLTFLSVFFADLPGASTPYVFAQGDCPAPDASSPLEVLVFSRTEGFRHGSITDGLAMMNTLATQRNWNVTTTEDNTFFTPANLSGFDVVVWLNTTGDVLDAPEEAAFQTYIEGGGGFAGIHSATDTEYDWAWYGELVGAYFDGHPAIQNGTIDVEITTHPATVDLPNPWMKSEEWYNFESNPRSIVDVLLTVDETTYSGGTMGDDHPISWAHTNKGGRAFYTALGHSGSNYTETNFVNHVRGGIEWAAGHCDPDDPPATGNPTSTPDINPTATATPEPGSTAEPDPNAPQIEGDLTTSLVLPTFMWLTVNGATWYEVIIRDASDKIAFSVWVEAANVCDTDCMYTPSVDDLPAGLLNGDYTWQVGAYIPTTEDITYTDGNPFEVNVPPPSFDDNMDSVDANNGRPIVTFGDDPNTTWVQLYIGKPGSIAFFGWLPKSDADCANGLCTFAPDINPTGGSYSVWIQFFGAAGFSTGGQGGWYEIGTFDLPTTPPAAPSGLTSTFVNGDVVFAWDAPDWVTWYNLWAGSPDFQTTYHYEWHLADDLCADGACALTVTDVMQDYVWYLSGWGPGGFTDGDIPGGWVEGE